MKTWFVFIITNYFGLSTKIKVWANNTEEVLKIINEKIDYQPEKIEYVGMDLLNENYRHACMANK